MSEPTFGHKKTAASKYSNPSLVSPTTPTLANPVRGFGLPTNNLLQTATEVSTDQQESQSADQQLLLEQQTLTQKPITHNISRISLHCRPLKLTVPEVGDKYEQQADTNANQVMFMPASRSVIQRQTPPPVHLEPHRRNRSRPIDWNTRDSSFSPEAIAGTDEDTSLREMFEVHRQAQIAAIFGNGMTLEQVYADIARAREEGRTDEVERLRTQLFAANQYAVIATLNPEQSDRYAPIPGGKTYCNIYAYDVVSALGGYLPRVWWTPSAIHRIERGSQVISLSDYLERRRRRESVENYIAPIYGGSEGTVFELNANALTTWMETWGDEMGWRRLDSPESAQAEANNGKIVIVLAANVNPSRSGHVAVVVAETSLHQAQPNTTVNNPPQPNTSSQAQPSPSQQAQSNSSGSFSPLQSQAGRNNYNFRQGSPAWWQDRDHERGAFWVYEGQTDSPLSSPELLGAHDSEISLPSESGTSEPGDYPTPTGDTSFV
ncbi:MAG: hypothetical protein RMY29_022490 [Nostoc sp. CreGUA01]|nr:hypothetical protein [Nostoc sp. CreGUA01]